MNKIKYLLFTILLSSISILNVNAKEELMHCEYSRVYINTDRTEYIKYKVTYYDDKSVLHEYVPSNGSNFIKGNNNHNQVGVFDNDGNRAGTMSGLKDNFSATEMEKYYAKKVCPYIVYTSATGSLANRQITPSEVNNLDSYNKEDYREIAVSMNNGTYIKKDNNTSSPNNNNSNLVCVYEPSYTAPYQYSITCKPGTNTANCTVKDSYNQLSIASDAVKFNLESSCPNTIYISYDQNNVITNINTTSGEALSLNKNKSSEGTTTNPNNPTTPTEPSTPEEPKKYENDSRYIEALADYEKYCNDPRYKNNAKCEEAQNKINEVIALYENTGGELDLEHFCQGPVQGVFTTLGWIFFILKILIPILIVVFGSIDVGKAVIASKDDEIKKSVKSLTFRVIAGFIIFFVPTILNFAVKMIDNSDVYNGTFWDCTKCMLDPINNVCSTLRGEN